MVTVVVKRVASSSSVSGVQVRILSQPINQSVRMVQLDSTRAYEARDGSSNLPVDYIMYFAPAVGCRPRSDKASGRVRFSLGAHYQLLVAAQQSYKHKHKDLTQSPCRSFWFCGKFSHRVAGRLLHQYAPGLTVTLERYCTVDIPGHSNTGCMLMRRHELS